MVLSTYANTLLAEHDSFPDLLTDGNAFVNVGADWDCRFLGAKRIHLSATTNDLSVQILGSVDGGSTFPEVVVSAFTVTVGTLAKQEITGVYSSLRVQVKPNVNDQHGTLSTQYAGRS